MADLPVAFPPALSSYHDPVGSTLWQTLVARVHAEPFNLIATGIFLVAIVHTFVAPLIIDWSHRLQHRHDARVRAAGLAERPSVRAEVLHFFGEVELIFGLWAIVLLAAITQYYGWNTAHHYFNDEVTFTEPMFVVVIMALASTRPVTQLAERALRLIANAGGGTPAAWWATILVIGPLIGSFITEPGAMTISALLLARQFFNRGPRPVLKYATLGLLFVNVSIGGTLTHFAAPPVLMVARPWGWDTPFMLAHFGLRATAAILVSTAAYYLWFRREMMTLTQRPVAADNGEGQDATHDTEIPGWLTLAHVLFLAWTVLNAHSPVLFVGGFLLFLGLAQATAYYQGTVEIKTPLLVGFFLAGLVIHGGLQAWWIAPVLARLSELPLFVGATILTGFNDNALITYLGTLVPNLSDSLKRALLEGAVTGGGLTVIANAPNPAGQALLSRFFDGAVHPLKLLAAALLPTLIAAAAFRLF